MGPRRPRAGTFDFGYTLCDLDTAMLARRLAERGIAADAARLEARVGDARRAYDAAIAAGLGGHPWKLLMGRLLELGGVEPAAVGPAVDWLWTEQPKQNLWQRPIPGMIELVRELCAAGVAVGIVSNSEGRLAELVEQVGWSADFAFVADSGRLGVEKPDPAIFHYALERLGGLSAEEVVHVGDSWGADVEGALRAGLRAVWFTGDEDVRSLPEGVRRASNAAGVRAALCS